LILGKPAAQRDANYFLNLADGLFKNPRALNSSPGHPHPPPQPGRLRLERGRHINPAMASTTMKRAMQVWSLGVIAQKPRARPDW